MSINLDALSIAELEKLTKDAAVLVEKRREQALKDAREQILAIAAGVGMSVEELLGLKTGNSAATKTGRTKGKGKSKISGKKVAAKYMNPKNPEETWTGRGRKPSWLQAELDKGKKLESFLI